MNPCPPGGQLRLLLDNRLSEAEENELEVHLARCSPCRAALEEMTTPPLAARAAPPGDSAAEAAFADVLRALQSGRPPWP